MKDFKYEWNAMMRPLLNYMITLSGDERSAFLSESDSYMNDKFGYD